MLNDSSQSLTNRLRADLLTARKARDSLTTATLQAVVSAIDNAGAVPVLKRVDSTGVGSTEVPRRELSAYDMQEIVKHEVTELQQAITGLGSAKSAYVDELSNKIVILQKYL